MRNRKEVSESEKVCRLCPLLIKPGSRKHGCQLEAQTSSESEAVIDFPRREGIDQSYQLLRDSLDLYLAMYPDQVQLLLLQARLYFHLGIWPEKVII